MKRFALVLLASCSGSPFTLADNIQPITVEGTTDAALQQTTEQDAAPAVGITNVRELPDAQSGNRDSGSNREVANDSGQPDAVAQGWEADTAAAVADAGKAEADSQAESSGIEASAIDAACPPAPVAPDGYSNICATAPSRGSSIIETFPGECACNWTCACLMTSSVCQGLGTPQSCQVVNGATCNSVVVAVVICK